MKPPPNDRVEDIFKSLAKVAKMIGDVVPADRLMLIAELLSTEVPNDENLVMAFKMIVLRETRFPPPAKFIEYAGAGVRARAQDALENLFKAVKVYHHGDPGNARRFVGEAAWRTLESCGGWSHFCLDDKLNIEVFRAQFLKSYEDRVPIMEASGELKREFLGAGKVQALLPANDLNKAIASKDKKTSLQPGKPAE